MKNTIEFILSSLLLIFVSGCGLMPRDLTPPDSTPHQVQSTATHLTLTFNESMIWGAGEQSPGVTKWVRFPAGVYILEAEDKDDYYYFKAPEPLDIRTIKNAHLVGSNLEGQLIDGRKIDGGLFIGKSVWRMVPAGAYFSSSDVEKIWLNKMGGDFLAMEPIKWKRDY